MGRKGRDEKGRAGVKEQKREGRERETSPPN